MPGHRYCRPSHVSVDRGVGTMNLLRLEEQNGTVAEVEVDEVFSLYQTVKGIGVSHRIT